MRRSLLIFVNFCCYCFLVVAVPAVNNDQVDGGTSHEKFSEMETNFKPEHSGIGVGALESVKFYFNT